MTTVSLKRKDLSLNEVARAVTYVNAVEKEKNLEQKQLKAEEVQQILRFTKAVYDKQCQLLKNNAVTLLRLIRPLFLAKSSATVHNVIGLAVPVVKDMYTQDPNSEQGQDYKALLENAGKVCFHPRLTPTVESRRLFEFAVFKSLIGETPEYKHAQMRYQSHRKAGLKNYYELAEDPNGLPLRDWRSKRISGNQR